MFTRIFLISLYFLISSSFLKSQSIGIENEDGIIDTLLNLPIIFTPWEICQGSCIQFHYLESRNRAPLTIYYEDSIFWRFKLGEPNYSEEKNPFVCFPELGGPDSIELTQRVFKRSMNIRTTVGMGHAKVYVVPCPPEAAFEPDREVVCVGHPVHYADSSKLAPDEWIWTFEGGVPEAWSGPDPPPVYYPDTGTYTTSLYVANTAGEDSLVRTRLIEVRDGPQPVSPWTSAYSAPFGSAVRLTPCSIGDWYEWYPSDGLSCTDCPEPELTVGHQSQYRVTTGLHGFDCVDTCDITIETLPVDELIWFPNAFSPNGDGINDLFTGYGKHIELVELKIFDRWGNALHSASGPQAAWDGTAKGRDVQPGSYVFYAIYKKLYTEETDIIYGEVSVYR